MISSCADRNSRTTTCYWLLKSKKRSELNRTMVNYCKVVQLILCSCQASNHEWCLFTWYKSVRRRMIICPPSIYTWSTYFSLVSTPSFSHHLVLFFFSSIYIPHHSLENISWSGWEKKQHPMCFWQLVSSLYFYPFKHTLPYRNRRTKRPETTLTHELRF